MRKIEIFIGLPALTLIALFSYFATSAVSQATAVAQQTAVTAHIVTAAENFLSTVDAEQRKHVLYAFNDNEQRQKWSNFPTGVVPRGGINFKQMTEPQRDAAMKLLASVLSPMGLEKVDEIRQADDDFKANGSKRGPGGGPGGPGGPPPGASGPQPGSGPGPGGAGGAGRGRPPSGDDLFGSDLYYFSF